MEPPLFGYLMVSKFPQNNIQLQYYGFPFKVKELAMDVSLLFPGGEDHEIFDFTEKINTLYEKIWQECYKSS
jgi:hypothetical protein